MSSIMRCLGALWTTPTWRFSITWHVKGKDIWWHITEHPASFQSRAAVLEAPHTERSSPGCRASAWGELEAIPERPVNRFDFRCPRSPLRVQLHPLWTRPHGRACFSSRSGPPRALTLVTNNETVGKSAHGLRLPKPLSYHLPCTACCAALSKTSYTCMHCSKPPNPSSLVGDPEQIKQARLAEPL